MAAPTFTQAGAGFTDAGGAWSYSTGFNAAVGSLTVLHIFQDGSTTGAVTGVAAGSLDVDLAGTTSAVTTICVDQPCGSPTAGLQHIYVCRRITTASQSTFTGSNSTSEDLYMNAYEFANVSTGTTLATVIENGTAGNFVNGVGTGTTISDTAVTTLGADRLALNLIGINDDASGIESFAGESGGNWTIPTNGIFASSTGTDGTVALQTAAMASAGTINGGSDTIVSLSWGVIGFALIGTTSGANTYEKAGFGKENG